MEAIMSFEILISYHIITWHYIHEGHLQSHGLTLLLSVETLWRCGDSLFFEVPPLASDALLTALHPLLENVLWTIDHFEISRIGAPFS
jgi:hypothetical protein